VKRRKEDVPGRGAELPHAIIRLFRKPSGSQFGNEVIVQAGRIA
jgi:hypothetical protein